MTNLKRSTSSEVGLTLPCVWLFANLFGEGPVSRVNSLIRQVAERYLRSQGLKAVGLSKAPAMLHPDVWDQVRAHTMTDSARVDALYEAVRQIAEQAIPGDLVECGVYKGGCSMTMALALSSVDKADRTLWLYDTFAGMTRPTSHDVRIHDGKDAMPRFEELATSASTSSWCAADLDTVRANMRSTGYPDTHLRFIVGPVEETLQNSAPDRIAVLRLDTDWYESTKVELETLVPRLSPGGVLIIDDYNHWSGARRAVDEYFTGPRARPIFFPVGKSSVMATIS